MLAACLISLLLVLTILGSLRVGRTRLLLKLAIGLAAFAVISALLIPLVGSTLHPVFPPDADPIAAVTQRIFVASWWLLAARIVVLAGRVVLGLRHQEHAVRLASDLASAAIYLGAVLTILSVTFSVSVTGLVATSGIIAIVVGLALQSTLGDLFSGIAIGIEKPFDIGDYIWLEGGIEGSVIETNWRATRIVTDANDIATVPNSVIAKGRLLNRSRPTEIRTDTIRIVLDSAVLPRNGIELLEAAALGTDGLADDPRWRIVCTNVSGEGTVYELRFSAPRRDLVVTRSSLLDSVARHARYAGVAMAMQNSLPLQPVPTPECHTLLAEIDLLSDLSEPERRNLASHTRVRRGRRGERLFDQGDTRASLFFVAQGVFEVVYETGTVGKRLGVITPGEHFGELSVLTGASTPATVAALTAFVVYELTKEALALPMRENPNLLHAFEAGAARSRERIDSLLVAQDGASEESGGRLIDRIRAFFDLPF